MFTTKEIFLEIKKMLKRRRKILLFTPVFFVLLSIAALYIIKPEYESSTTILVEQEETFYPVDLFDIDSESQSDRTKKRLEALNEYLYSRSTIEMLIDSLGLEPEGETEAEKREFVEDLRENILTEFPSSDSFEITYIDTDPERARDAVKILADGFIETQQRLESRRSSESVEYLAAKVNDMKIVLDEQREQDVNATTEQMRISPSDREALQSRLENTEEKMEELDWRIYQEENKVKVIEGFLEQGEDDFTHQLLYKLSLENIPYGTELSELLEEYDELDQQYTESYPRLRTLRERIIEVARRIPPAMKSDIEDLNEQRKGLQERRNEVVENMESTYVAERSGSSRQSNMEVYQELYDEMQVKLEEAKMKQDINSRVSEQFQELDAPFVAEEPSSPNKKIVLAIGLVLGIIMGGIFMILAEVLDNTVRSETDLEYQKPVIAYLSDGRI